MEKQYNPKAILFKYVVLEDDETPYGGKSTHYETLGEFMDETGLDYNTTLEDANKALQECGIKPINPNQTNTLFKYKAADLTGVLCDMADYIRGMEEDELKGYFDEIINTGIFHDAIGKMIAKSETEVVVSTDY